MQKKHIAGLAACLVLPVLLAAVVWLFLWTRIPDEIYAEEGTSLEGLLSYPLDEVIEEEVVTVLGQDSSNIPQGQVRICCSLFGVIPVKDVEVTLCEEKKVWAGGEPVGIYMKTDGVLVVGTGEITQADGTVLEPARNIVRSGDYILEANGQKTETKEDLISCLAQCAGSDVVLAVNRGGEVSSIRLSPMLTAQQDYKLGIWVRDDTQGIGTLTYVDEEGNFGALGHGISDVDTGTLLALQEGTLYRTNILSVIKGTQGIPGELSGVIRYAGEEIIGTIAENTQTGIFGNLNRHQEEYEKGELVEIAYKQDVETGPAVIRSSVSGELKEYDIVIEKVRVSDREVNKSMVIRITDPELLEITGGIVQGMSGSPILQNGKLIGAVTHVFVNDSTCGYGIFVEDMLGH